MSDTAKEILTALQKLLSGFPEYVTEAKHCLQIVGNNQSRETSETLLFVNNADRYMYRYVFDVTNMLINESLPYIDYKLIVEVAHLLKRLPQHFPANIQPIMDPSIVLLRALISDMDVFLSLCKIYLSEKIPDLGSTLDRRSYIPKKYFTPYFSLHIECIKLIPPAPPAPSFEHKLFQPPLPQPSLPENPKVNPAPPKLNAEQKSKIIRLITALERETSIFCWYLNKERKRKKITALREVISETDQGKGIAEIIARIDGKSQYRGIRSGIFSTRVNDLLNELTPIKNIHRISNRTF